MRFFLTGDVMENLQRQYQNFGWDLLGLTSILLVILITVILAKRWPSVALILYAALSVRIFTIFLSNGYIILPDSAGDAFYFENRAYLWSKHGFPNVLDTYPGWADSFFISYLLGILYSLTDRSVVMAQSISLFFGMLSILMSWIIAQKIWGDRTASKVGWISAFFPSLILYSSIIMREIYVCFFLLLALNYVVDWYRTNSLKSFFLVILSFMIGMAFHGGVFIGLFVFLTVFLFSKLKNILRKLIRGLITIKSLFFIPLVAVLLTVFISSNVFIPKIGYITDIDKLTKNILKKNNTGHRGAAKYPAWTIAISKNELIYKVPIRAIYLTFSPFPWDVKKSNHLIGMFDGLLYMYLVYLIFCNRKIIWEDPVLRFILLILFAYLCVYGIAVSNFGTGIRHRSKFVIMFILLAGPLLPKIVFFKKKSINKY